MTFRFNRMNSTESKAITRRHHSYHPLLGQSASHRRRNSTTITKPHTVIRHNVSSSNQWQFKLRSSSIAVSQSSNSSILRIYPSNQGSEKNSFLSRTSVLSGTETIPGNNFQGSFKLPASVAVITTAAIFFTFTLASTLVLGILCQREKKMRIRLCSSASSSFSSSNDVTWPSSGVNESKSNIMKDDEEFHDGKEGQGQTLLDSHETDCPLHTESCATLNSQGHFYWFQDGESFHDDEYSYGCYGSYPFIATYLPEMPVSPSESWQASAEDFVHYCNTPSGYCPNFRLSEINAKPRNNENDTAGKQSDRLENARKCTPNRAAVEHSCSLDELTAKKSKKLSRRRFYERLRGKSRGSIKSSSASTVSYSEIPSRQTDDLSSDCSRGEVLISHGSYETVSTRISHRSVTKSENESRLASSRESENETGVKSEHVISHTDAHSCDETEAMLP